MSNTPGLRDLLYAISPQWLGGGTPPGEFHNGQRFEYSASGLPPDMLYAKAEMGVWDRMPGREDPSATPYLARDRGLVQGIGESQASFDARLRGAIAAAGLAGSDRAVMSAVLAYIQGGGPEARTVSTSGVFTTWRTYLPGADITQPPASWRVVMNWDWDSHVYTDSIYRWWRTWLVLYSVAPTEWTPTEGTWGDGDVWGDSTKSWGLGIPATQVQTMQAIIKQNKRAGAWVRYMIVSFDASLFDPAQSDDGAHNPDGTWHYCYKIVSGNYVKSRPANARYCGGAL